MLSLNFQGHGSDGSSPCSTPTPGSQVTKVTATAKFKVEVHAPTASFERPSSSRSRSRRTCPSRSSSAASTLAAGAAGPLHPTPPGSVHSSLSDSLRSSLANSVSSSLSSNEGDLGFSEKWKVNNKKQWHGQIKCLVTSVDPQQS